MKKTMKILGGSLLVALMSISLATKLNVREVKHLEVRDLLTEDMTKPVTGKVVRFAANEEAGNKISKAKAQIADAGEGKRHIRFVVGLDSVNYADAKFNIVAKDGDNVVKTFADQPVTTAYTHIEAAGVVQSAAQVFGADYNYLMAFTIKNVPASAWDYNFEVTSSVKTEEAAEWTTSEVATKNISKIAELDKEEIAAPAFDWQGVVEGGEENAYSANNAGINMTIYKGAPAGHYFNIETKALNLGLAAGDNAEWWAVQLFAAPANIAVGNEYEVSFDFYSPVAGKIRVRQQNYDVVVGNNTISYKTTYAGGTNVDSAPFSLQFATPESSREEVIKMLNVDGDVNPYVISNFMMREVEKEAPIVGEEKELVFGSTWNPHGTYYLVFSWKNPELNNDVIESYSATAVKDGVEYPFRVMHNDGPMAKFFYNDQLGDIEKATYTLVVEFITFDGVSYKATLEVVDGKKLTLDVAKKNNVAKLNGYLAEKDYKEIKYSPENWSRINELLANGVANVNAATSIADANNAMNDAIAAIDAIEQLNVISVDVVFYNGEEEVAKLVYVIGEKLGDLPKVPGFDVEGWYTTSTFEVGTEVTSDTVVEGAMSLYAKTIVASLPSFDVMLNSAVNGAWIYCSITWQDGYALTDADIVVGNFVLSNGSTVNYTNRVGATSINGNTIKLGLGFADARFMNQDVTLRLTVTTGGVSYNIDVAAFANTGSGVDYTMHSVVVSFA